MSKTKRRSLPVDCQFQRLQSQWRNGRTGAGAWFWRHLKPVLYKDQAGNPKELHLQCEHCSKLFSARNPSRTSLEHLKSGACSVFRSTTAFEAVKASPRQSQSGKKTRKLIKTDQNTDVLFRKLQRVGNDQPSQSVELTKPSLPVNKQMQTQEVILSFFLEASDVVPISLMEHPRMLQLSSVLGFQPLSPHEVLTNVLNKRVEEVQEEIRKRLRKSEIYQGSIEAYDTLHRDSLTINLFLNFPDSVPSFHKHLEMENKEIDLNVMVEVMSSALTDLTTVVDRSCCVGWIVSMKSSSKFASQMMEAAHPWMINITCQISCLQSLIKDLCKHVVILKETIDMAKKIMQFSAQYPQILPKIEVVSTAEFVPAAVLGVLELESVFHSRRGLEQGALLHRHAELPEEGIEVLSAILDVNFWRCVRETRTLLNPLLESVHQMEQTQFYLSQMLDMWKNVESLIQQWCQRDVEAYSGAMEVFKKRFNKSYHPAMSAAFLLDPAFCIKQEPNLLVPDWTRLNHEQQEDACFILKKLSSSSRYGRILTDFNHWQTNGLPEDFMSIVCDRQTTAQGAKTGCLSKVVPMVLRRAAWTSCLKDLEALGVIAQRLLSLRASIRRPRTTGADWRPPSTIEDKLNYISINARLASDSFISEKKLDQELLTEISKGLMPAEKSKADLVEEEAGVGAEIQSPQQEGNFQFLNRDESQLYMQQLNLNTSGVLDLAPPPLGTMPELPIPSVDPAQEQQVAEFQEDASAIVPNESEQRTVKDEVDETD